MKLIILENTDQDRFGIDTVLMVVAGGYDQDKALEESGLERPKIVGSIEVEGPADEHKLEYLGRYRGFMG